MSRDDYVSNGPVSSMPGNRWPHTEGFRCENEGEDGGCAAGTKADWKIQGETDSFGCEYFFLCNQCEEKRNARRLEEEEKRDGYCSYHKGMGSNLRLKRDILGEGTSGPVYDMCEDCRKRLNEDAEAEARLSDNHDDDYEDSGDNARDDDYQDEF